jgi:hypothetical protein
MLKPVVQFIVNGGADRLEGGKHSGRWPGIHGYTIKRSLKGEIGGGGVILSPIHFIVNGDAD